MPAFHKKIAAGNKCFCQFKVRFFCKGFYFIYTEALASTSFVLNISIARIGISGFNTNGNQGIEMIYKIQRFVHKLPEIYLHPSIR